MTTDTCRIAASRLATFASALLVVASGPGCVGSPGEADVERGARTEVGSPMPARQPGLECERERYPCAWADVDTAVFDRSLALGEEALERMTADSVASAAAWLRGLSEVARVEATDRALSFRLDRGGPVWVIADDSEGFRGSGNSRSARHPLPPRGLESPGASRFARDVVGRDTDGNDRINQRDQRRARVLDPFHWEFAGDWSDYGEGRQVAEILERSREYAGRVELLEDEAAGLAAFRSWDQFDAVHVASHGHSFGCDPNGWCRGGIVTGERLDVQELDAEVRAALKASLKESGIAIAVSGKGKKKTDAKDATPGAGDQAAGNAGLSPELLNAPAWQLGVTADFFVATYPAGLGKTIVVLSTCNSYSDIVPALFPQGGNDGPNVFAWSGLVFIRQAQATAASLWSHLIDDGFDTADALLRTRASLPVASALERVALVNHRAREIVRLVDRGGSDLRDGSGLAALLEGVPGDGVPDEISVVAKVDGVTSPANEFIVDLQAAQVDESLHMEVWLELDGQRIGPSVGLWDKPRDGTVITVPFARVPLGFDVQPGRTYELEAVVWLPREGGEDGESRYSARVAATPCAVPSQGDFTGTLSGERARLISSSSRGAFAKILRSPLGGWALQLESRERDGNDLGLTLMFDQLPVEGGTATIDDPDLPAVGVGGMVDRFDRERQANWHSGLVRITFDVVREVPGKRFRWVCGAVTADLVGARAPPPGTMQPVTVTGTFEGRFQAEWYHER